MLVNLSKAIRKSIIPLLLVFAWNINANPNPDWPLEDTIQGNNAVKALFASDEILDITIYFDDLKKLKRDISDDPSNHKACVLVNNVKGKDFFEIKVKTRGNFRKNPMNCNFPPLKLDFRKDELGNSIFEGQNRLKLVTHCRSGNMEYDQYVIQEYLAYRIYNIITDKSFKVRLARVNYIDNLEKCKAMTRYAFLIEDADDMAERNGYTHVELKNIPQTYTDYFYENLLSVYQYMIGNTDWSVPGMHNIKLILEKPDHRPVPVPYDFDFSGIVNTYYSFPSEKLAINSVEERLFRGYERPMEDFQKVLDYLFTKQDEIMSLYENSQLSEKQKTRAIEYLDEFFSIISDEDLINREFVMKAKKYQNIANLPGAH